MRNASRQTRTCQNTDTETCKTRRERKNPHTTIAKTWTGYNQKRLKRKDTYIYINIHHHDRL